MYVTKLLKSVYIIKRVTENEFKKMCFKKLSTNRK